MPGESGSGLVGEHHQGGVLPDRWERSETPKGIPYYINHQDGTSHWEHPEIEQAFEQIDGMNGIKYAAYRTAMKLRAIQKLTHLNVVEKHILVKAFNELGLGSPQNSEVLTVPELETFLNKLFHLAQRGRAQFIQPDTCVEITLNWVLKCLDSGRTAMVKVRSLKVILAILCSATLEEKYTYIYQQVKSEHSVGISQTTLKILLQDLMLLPLNVSESGTFGVGTIDNAIDNCWTECIAERIDLVNEREFLSWMQREPVCIVWIPTLHRLSSAETVKHEAKCAKCKSFPIVGFRYRCLKCTNVDFCQSCFWTQQTLKNHKATHPTREYCLATTTGDDVRDFAKQLKYKITRKYRRQPPKKSYLDYPVTARAPEERIPDQSPLFNNIHTRANLLASRLQELEGGNVAETIAPVPRPSAITVEVEHHSYPASPELQSPLVEDHHEREQMESRISHLQGENEQLYAQVDRLTHLLEHKPKPPPPAFIKVPVPVGTVAAAPETRTQGVNTPTLPDLPSIPSRTFTTGEWSSLFGGEEEEMDAMVIELLAAFPTQTTETVARDLNTQLLRSAQIVGSTLGAMVQEVANNLS